MSGVRSIVRAEWRDLALYRPPQAPVEINLSDNTSRFGVPPSALAVLQDVTSAGVTRYPDAYGAPLKEALAAYAGVTPEEIATGCGSDDILDSAFRAFARPGERLAHLAPTFPMAAWFARINALEPVSAPLAADGSFDPGALLAGDPAIVYLCSPNNPTGAALDPAAVERVLERAPGVVLLDEAYAEFAGPGWLAQAPKRRGLLVARTMSKAFGLAGLRVGYACGAAALVHEVELSRGPFKVNSNAERAATAAVRNDLAWVRARAVEAVALRDRLADGLRALGFSPLPSAANFVLVPVAGAPRIAAAMRASGVAVRPFEALPGVGDALRITAAPWPELERALAALSEALRCA
jgi:histidinol-phosphate aminotransferase